MLLGAKNIGDPCICRHWNSEWIVSVFLSVASSALNTPYSRGQATQTVRDMGTVTIGNGIVAWPVIYNELRSRVKRKPMQVLGKSESRKTCSRNDSIRVLKYTMN